MAFLKKIKFGTGEPTSIAKTLVQGKPEGVISVSNTSGYDNNDTEEKDYSYDIDVNVDNATIVKSSGNLAVGTVPAEKVSVTDSGEKFTATNVETALKELKDDIAGVTSQAKSYTIIKETSETEGVTLETNVLEQYKLQETVNGETSIVGQTIKIYKDSSLKSVELVDQELVFTYILDTGAESVVRVDVSKFLAESEFADGLQVTNHVVSVKVDSTSEKDSQATPVDFLTVGADGVKINGIKDEIDRKIAALDVTDTAVTGQYVSAVNEADGKVSMTRANVSDAVLNGYAKGEKPASTAIAATDDVKGAIAKLEHQIDDAKAAATTKVVEGTDEGNNMTIASATSETDGSTTYTINLTDVASKTALDAEIAARKAVDGQNGDTYAANANTNYISGATSLNDADVKLDAAIKAEETRANSAETAIDSVVGLTKAASGEGRTYTNTGNYIGKGDTNTVASDIKALDTQLKTVTDKVGEIQYKVNGTTLVFYGMTEKAGA